MSPVILGSSRFLDIVEQNQSKLSLAIFIGTSSLKMFLFVFKRNVNMYMNVVSESVCIYVFDCHVCLCFFPSVTHWRFEKQIFSSQAEYWEESSHLTSKWTLKYIGIRALNATLGCLGTLPLSFYLVLILMK